MKAAIYIRVSTSSKTDSGNYRQNPEVQERELRKLADFRKWELYKVYCDRMSGASSSRPAYKQLLDDARRGQFNVILVWRLDRWARSLKELVTSIEELKSIGIEFVCADQPIDTSTASGRLMYQILGAFAEFERSLTQERILAGLEYARIHGTKSGNPIGRQKKVFRRDQVDALRKDGLSYPEIARRLGVGYGTVRRSLAETLTREGAER